MMKLLHAMTNLGPHHKKSRMVPQESTVFIYFCYGATGPKCMWLHTAEHFFSKSKVEHLLVLHSLCFCLLFSCRFFVSSYPWSSHTNTIRIRLLEIIRNHLLFSNYLKLFLTLCCMCKKKQKKKNVVAACLKNVACSTFWRQYEAVWSC